MCEKPAKYLFNPFSRRCFSKFEGEGEGKGGEMAMAGRHVHVISHEMGC